jgi:GDP-L-fucose synthase
MDQFKVNLKIKFDKKKPNGTPRKILDTSLARSYGWNSKYDLIEGFKLTYNDFLKKTKN